MINGVYPALPAKIPSGTEKTIFLKKEPVVAFGIVGVLHYRADEVKATVRSILNPSFNFTHTKPENLRLFSFVFVLSV